MAVGTVRWFNTGSGYGFIATDDGGADLFVHRTSLGGGLRTTMAEGDRVEFEPRAGGIGPEAIDVIAVGPAETARRARGNDAAAVRVADVA